VNRERIARALTAACLVELRAVKPGNVSVYAGSEGMTCADFERSAHAIALPLTAPNASVGERIVEAITATRAVVTHNTNLGIVLLCAPLAAAAEAIAESADLAALRARLAIVLQALSTQDAVHAYRAISLAEAGGLGTVAEADIHAAPPANLTLGAAMALAAQRDTIAAEYGNGYRLVLDFGVKTIFDAVGAGGSLSRAISLCYLGVLSATPDTLIVRKWGQVKAAEVSAVAAQHFQLLQGMDAGAEVWPEGLAWDRALKAERINPGTTADLVVASVFSYLLLVGGTTVDQVCAA
jgi:triphosphoribosyl-dephospho-CoA synthase